MPAGPVTTSTGGASGSAYQAATAARSAVRPVKSGTTSRNPVPSPGRTPVSRAASSDGAPAAVASNSRCRRRCSATVTAPSSGARSRSRNGSSRNVSSPTSSA
ncbi:hypothetical protein DN402_08540 [Streptomyces sp. SW4]|nr:hypothetical protein DN402_08540 [Streptomyces sp. SW4]